MDAQIVYNSPDTNQFLFGIKKFTPAAAIIDDIFMLRHGRLVTYSNVIILYLAQECKQHPTQAALRIFSFIEKSN